MSKLKVVNISISVNPNRHDRMDWAKVEMKAYCAKTRMAIMQLPAHARHYDGERSCWWLHQDAWPHIKQIFSEFEVRATEDAERMIDGLSPVVEAQAMRRASIENMIRSWFMAPAPRIVHPPIPPEHQRFMDQLLPYQVPAVIHMAGRRRGIIAYEPRLGKTVMAIMAALLANTPDKPVLPCLVVTTSTTITNWCREIHKWAGHVADAVPCTTPNQWKAAVQRFTGLAPIPNAFVVTSYDNLRSQILQARLIPWNGIIVDEAHHIKDRSTARWKAIRQLIVNAKEDNRPVPSIRFALTGTPTVNSASDYLTLLGLCGDFGLFRSVANFEAAFVDIENTEAHPNLVRDRLSMLRKILSKQGAVIRKRFSEVHTQIPHIREIESFVDADDDALALYRQRIDEIRDAMNRGASAMSLTAHLEHLIMAAGLAKTPAVVAWAESRLELDEPVVIFYKHRVVGDVLEESLEQHGVVRIEGSVSMAARQVAVDAFQSGKANVFLGQIKAASEGIKLSRARQVAFAQFPWHRAGMTQAQSRVVTFDDTEQRESYWMICASTIEQNLVDIISNKAAISDAANDGMDTAPARVAESLLKIIKKGAS